MFGAILTTHQEPHTLNGEANYKCTNLALHHWKQFHRVGPITRRGEVAALGDALEGGMSSWSLCAFCACLLQPITCPLAYLLSWPCSLTWARQPWLFFSSLEKLWWWLVKRRWEGAVLKPLTSSQPLLWSTGLTPHSNILGQAESGRGACSPSGHPVWKGCQLSRTKDCGDSRSEEVGGGRWYDDCLHMYMRSAGNRAKRQPWGMCANVHARLFPK